MVLLRNKPMELNFVPAFVSKPHSNPAMIFKLLPVYFVHSLHILVLKTYISALRGNLGIDESFLPLSFHTCFLETCKLSLFFQNIFTPFVSNNIQKEYVTKRYCITPGKHLSSSKFPLHKKPSYALCFFLIFL